MRADHRHDHWHLPRTPYGCVALSATAAGLLAASASTGLFVVAQAYWLAAACAALLLFHALFASVRLLLAERVLAASDTPDALSEHVRTPHCATQGLLVLTLAVDAAGSFACWFGPAALAPMWHAIGTTGFALLLCTQLVLAACACEHRIRGRPRAHRIARAVALRPLVALSPGNVAQQQ